MALAAAMVSALWSMIVPPFEGLDELYSYNRAVQFSTHPWMNEPLFHRLTSIVLGAQPKLEGPAELRYNPAFEFVSNERGAVNRFVHERSVTARAHIRGLYALRALVAGLSVLTALCVYGIARVTLDDGDAAFAIALVCIAIPQYAFMNAVVHGEAVTRLFGAAATLVIVAGAMSRIRRVVMWIALALLLALTPLVDRQAFFIIPFAAVAVIIAEPTRRLRVTAAVILTVPCIAVAWLVATYNESGNFAPWFALLRHPIRPLLNPDSPGAAYYIFEFLPKLFISFWGWLGQPSILLPPSTYGALGAATLVGIGGAAFVLASGRSALVAGNRDRLRVMRLLAFGIALMCVPIAYGPALAGRNLWYGRWLFAMVGPIVLLLGVGWAAVLETAERKHRVAMWLAVLGAILAALWIAPTGAVFRRALEANHYGDRAHLTATTRDTIVALLVVAGALEATMRWPLLAQALRNARAASATALALNAAVLLGIVAPLYRPSAVDDYVRLIRRDLSHDRAAHGAEIYAEAVKSYPNSQVLRALADETPRLLVSSQLDEMSGLLQQVLARGVRFRDRDSLLALAHNLRGSGLGLSDAIDRAVARERADPELAEPAELVRIVATGSESDPSAATRAILAGRGRLLRVSMLQGEAFLEGVTAHTLPGGRVQVMMYYRPQSDWSNRKPWLHAYPRTAPDTYLDPEPVITSSMPVKFGQLDWAEFTLPPGKYDAYVGLWVGASIGSAVPIGPVP